MLDHIFPALYKHIIVCGHYDCGGVAAALDDHEHGLIDNWLRHIEDVRNNYEEQLEGLDREEKVNTLCELNIKEQVKNVCRTSIVQSAWKSGQDLSVHGWIYNIENGILEDLGADFASDKYE